MQYKVLYMTLLLTIGLTACKMSRIDSQALVYPTDDMKITVSHIGANCPSGPAADPTHHLDGDNGELVHEQARALDKSPYGFSGDAVLGRTSAASITKMEDIEAKCRRLILSMDVRTNAAGKPLGIPIIPQNSLLTGSIPYFTEVYYSYYAADETLIRPELRKKSMEQRKKRFEQDFGKNNYGEITCEEYSPFCTFANIKGKHGGKRYFTYLEPDNETKKIEFDLIIPDYFTGEFTLKGLYRANSETVARFSEAELATPFTDAVKLAVKHIGANCDSGPAADPTHHLNGDNGELMLEQTKHRDDGVYGFSGDTVMGRTSATAVTKMEDIEAKCRRLILSLDVETGRYKARPYVKHGDSFKGQIPQYSDIFDADGTVRYVRGSDLREISMEKRKKRFEQDFGRNSYGRVICSEYSPFCTFANIKGKNGRTRYFTYIEPDNDTKTIEAVVAVDANYFKNKIIINGIYRADPTTLKK